MTDVSIRACADYTPEAAEAALLGALAPFGGLDWVRPGMRIAVKANLVSMMKPEAAATTHPELLAALTRLLRAHGAQVVIGDSPGGLYTPAYVSRIYAATGMHAAEAAGAELNQDFSQATASFPEAVAARQFAYTAYLDRCDAIINFCKLKTHGMMGLSAAAKNLFGVVPGTIKPEYHFRFPTPEQFSEMILDLNEYFHPRLCICDAVVGMEGNGPTQGRPRRIGAVLAAENPHRLDLLAASLIGLDPQTVPTLRAAMARGLTPSRVEVLQVDGDWRQFCVPDYDRIEHFRSMLFTSAAPGALGKLFGGVARRCLSSRPQPEKRACTGCGLCARICPASAIEMKERRPQIDRTRCIGCFCCQEFCPSGSMKVHRPAIARLLTISARK